MAYIVCFRFKFYPSDPMLLKEEVSRYQLVLQLRRDILHGRLYSTLSDMGALASFIIQCKSFFFTIFVSHLFVSLRDCSRHTMIWKKRISKKIHRLFNNITNIKVVFSIHSISVQSIL